MRVQRYAIGAGWVDCEDAADALPDAGGLDSVFLRGVRGDEGGGRMGRRTSATGITLRAAVTAFAAVVEIDMASFNATRAN